MGHKTTRVNGRYGYEYHVELSPAAIIGGLEQALPHFTGDGGVCQQLAGVVGDGQGHGDR